MLRLWYRFTAWRYHQSAVGRRWAELFTQWDEEDRRPRPRQ